jgi:hypothetical protein
MKELRKVYYEVIIWQLTRSVSNTNDTLRHSIRGWGSPVTVTVGITKLSLQIQSSTSCYRPTADCLSRNCFWIGCARKLCLHLLFRSWKLVANWLSSLDLINRVVLNQPYKIRRHSFCNFVYLGPIICIIIFYFIYYVDFDWCLQGHTPQGSKIFFSFFYGENCNIATYNC